MATTRPTQTKYSEQNVLSTSFDPIYGLLQVESMSYNPVLSQMEAITGMQGNGSMTISNADTTVTSTKVLTKTIGSTSYTKTISYNAAGDAVSISAWS